jgi:hypothetical protein
MPFRYEEPIRYPIPEVRDVVVLANGRAKIAA